VIRVARNTVGNAAATVSESVDPSACVRSEVYAEYEAPDRQAFGSYTVLHFRSVDSVIEFLGRMLRVPPRLRPLRFDLSPDWWIMKRFDPAQACLTFCIRPATARRTATSRSASSRIVLFLRALPASDATAAPARSRSAQPLTHVSRQ
jgi:hypothetical protein